MMKAGPAARFFRSRFQRLLYQQNQLLKKLLCRKRLLAVPFPKRIVAAVEFQCPNRLFCRVPSSREDLDSKLPEVRVILVERGKKEGVVQSVECLGHAAHFICNTHKIERLGHTQTAVRPKAWKTRSPFADRITTPLTSILLFDRHRIGYFVMAGTRRLF